MQRRDRLKVGVVQLDTRFGENQANLAKHLDWIERARAKGVELLVFPETSLSGFPHGQAWEGALPRDGDEVEQLAQAAGSMTVAFGLIEEAPSAQFYNTSLVVRDGALVHIHRKLNLPTYGSLEEGKHFAQGRYVDGFNLPQSWWRVCTLVCADVWNPALVHLAALHGATLLTIPINSAQDAVSSEFSNPAGWDLVSRFYSTIYGMPLLLANRVGTEAGLRFWGGSRIVDPFGAVLAEADDQAEVLLDAELSYEDVRRARVQLPTVRDSNLSLVKREIERLEPLIGVPDGVRS